MKFPRSWISKVFPYSLFVIIFALSATAQNQYFVASTGSDSNNGSQASPWKTIQKGLNSATLGSGGATITVACGTYNEDVSTTRSGSSNQPILLVSANPDTYCARSLAKSANSVVAIGSGATAHGGNYITVKGFEITGPSNNQGVAIQANDSAVVHNKIHDIQRNGACPDGGGMGVGAQWNGVPGTGPSDPSGINFNLVDSNIIYNIGSWPRCATTSHGIYHSSPYNTTTNNIVFHTAANGIVTYHYVTNNVIANNTVFGNVASGIFLSAKDINEDFSTVANNISINNGNIGIRATAFSPSGKVEGSNNVFSNNLTFGNAGGNYSLQNATAANQLTSGTTSSIFVNYTGDASGDYHLKSGSPAVGAGTSRTRRLPILMASRDWCAIDLGAFEFAAVRQPHRRKPQPDERPKYSSKRDRRMGRDDRRFRGSLRGSLRG